MMRAILPHFLSLLLALAAFVPLPPAAEAGGFGVSTKASAHTAIPKRLLRDEGAGAEEEEEEPAPPSFLEEVRDACVSAVDELCGSRGIGQCPLPIFPRCCGGCAATSSSPSRSARASPSTTTSGYVHGLTRSCRR